MSTCLLFEAEMLDIKKPLNIYGEINYMFEKRMFEGKTCNHMEVQELTI